MIAAGGGGLALVAMLEKSWRNNKDEIIEEIEDFVEEKTGLDIELDEAIEEVVDAAIDTAKDIAEDGDLDVSLKERAEDLKDSFKHWQSKNWKHNWKKRDYPLTVRKPTWLSDFWQQVMNDELEKIGLVASLAQFWEALAFMLCTMKIWVSS